MIDSEVIDSSVWIAYFVNGDYQKEIENDKQIIVSVISLIEVPKKLSLLNIPMEEIKKNIESIKKRAILKDVTKEIAEQSLTFIINKRLHMADAIIYATAIMSNSKLLTLDNDFRGLTNVTILESS